MIFCDLKRCSAPFLFLWKNNIAYLATLLKMLYIYILD